jgi:hypothetical protein
MYEVRGVPRCHSELNDARVALAQKKKYRPEVVLADRVLDGCWAALGGWLAGWKRLPGAPQASRAGAVYDALFHDGLAFIQLPYVEEWSESALRLQRLAADDHEKTVAELGGKEFVTRLRAAHEAYGERLEITSEELVGNLLKPLVEHRARATANAADASMPGGETPKPG